MSPHLISHFLKHRGFVHKMSADNTWFPKPLFLVHKCLTPSSGYGSPHLASYTAPWSGIIQAVVILLQWPFVYSHRTDMCAMYTCFPSYSPCPFCPINLTGSETFLLMPLDSYVCVCVCVCVCVYAVTNHSTKQLFNTEYHNRTIKQKTLAREHPQESLNPLFCSSLHLNHLSTSFPIFEHVLHQSLLVLRFDTDALNTQWSTWIRTLISSFMSFTTDQ